MSSRGQECAAGSHALTAASDSLRAARPRHRRASTGGIQTHGGASDIYLHNLVRCIAAGPLRCPTPQEQQQPGTPQPEELPIWVRREQQREAAAAAAGKGELPWPLYLLFSCFVAIASVRQRCCPGTLCGLLTLASRPVLGAFRLLPYEHLPARTVRLILLSVCNSRCCARYNPTSGWIRF